MCRTSTAGPAKHSPHCGHWCDDVVVGEVVVGVDKVSLTVDSRKVDMRLLEVEPVEEVGEVDDWLARILEESDTESRFLRSVWWWDAPELLS